MNLRIGFLCLPDIDSPIGGVKQIYRHVEHLQALGFHAFVISEHPSFQLSWFTSDAPVLGIDQFFASSEWNENNTLLVIPETYINLQLSTVCGHDLSCYRYVVFNQNAYYTYGEFNSNTDDNLKQFYFSSNMIHALAVSLDSCEFLCQNVGLAVNNVSRIINSVEEIFLPGNDKENIITWMPRKNPSHVNAVLSGLRVATRDISSIWSGQALSGITHDSVAKYLSKSRIFLSFGHPEGFGLPIAEAMASGCWVVGYSGIGGKELFEFGASDYVEFGNWTRFVKSTLSIIKRFESHPTDTAFRLKCQSEVVRNIYSLAAERDSISNAWKIILGKFSH